MDFNRTMFKTGLATKPESSNEKKTRLSFWQLTLLFSTLFMLVAYIMASPMVARNAYYKMLFPRRVYPAGHYEKNAVCGIKAEDVYFEAGKQRLHGWYFDKPNAKYVVLMHHGNGGNVSILQWYVELVLGSDSSILVYDYEGYGRSSGEASIEAVCRDANAAYEFLTKTKNWKDDQVINLGLSLGTGAAIQVAAEHPGAGLVLIAPYTSLWKTCRHVFQFLDIYPNSLWPEHDINSEEQIKKVKCPILIFHGKSDEMIPLSQSEQLKSVSNQYTKLVTLKCGHGNFSNERETMRIEMMNFPKKANSTQ